jgi:hypothetical protein
MSKLKVQMKPKAQSKKHVALDFYCLREKYFDIQSFELHLTFACLREAATAKAGILKFEIASNF